jgi:FtsP/CotA-like multicopper oxidase with cupredoxin domain
MHQAMFKVIGRYKFGTSQFLSKTGKKGVMGLIDPMPYVKGALLPPEFNEVGWKDTIRANPGELTLIAVKWVEYPGNYVYHCHILEHEEHDMMRALTIV